MNRRSVQKRRGISPFRVLLAALLVAAVALLVRLPGEAVSAEAEQRRLESAADAYWKAQEENNRLRALVAESGSDDFVERVARRDYGYCWYGETIYEVANIDELVGDAPYEVYQGEK